MECLVGIDDACNNLSSSIKWKAEEGRIYYIKVCGCTKTVASFEFFISSFFGPVYDECPESSLITPGEDIIALFTAGATGDSIESLCSVDFLNSSGVWYRFVGQGSAVSASTCSPVTTVATSISVFTGSCGGLSFVTQGLIDFDCQEVEADTATFLAEAGTEYFSVSGLHWG